MYFFDKPSKSRIALRGSSRAPASSAELIAAARAQREERARQRAQASAATSLQSAYRALRARRRYRSKLLSITESAVAIAVSVARSIPGDRSFHLPIEVENADILRTLVDVARSNDSIRRGGTLARVKVAAILVECAARASPELLNISDRINCLRRASEILRAQAGTVEDVLLDWNIYSSIASLVDCQLVPVESALEIIDATLCKGQSSNMWLSFAGNVLTRRDAAKKLALTEFKRPQFVFQLLKAMSEEDAYDKYGFGQKGDPLVALLLSNILYCGKTIWTKGDTDSLWSLVLVVMALVRRMPDSAFMTDEESDDDDDVTTSKTLPKATSATPHSSSRPETGNGGGSDKDMMDFAVVEDLMKSLSSIASEETVRALFTAAVSDGRAATVRVCKLFNLLTRREHGLRMNFQSALAFWMPTSSKSQVLHSASAMNDVENKSSHILAMLWRYCIDEDKNLDLLDDGSAVLLVFVRSYSHFLYVQDENEMFESRRPFSVEEVRELVLVLKRALFAALYVRTVSNGTFHATNVSATIIRSEPDLVDEIARLMSRLYTCDSRHPFRDSEDFWIAGGSVLTSNSFVQDAVNAGSDLLVPNSAYSSNQLAYNGVLPQSNGSNNTVAGAGNLLRVAPYMAPFSSRAKVFHTWVAAERKKFGPDEYDGEHGRWIRARRNYLFEDAFDQLSGLGEDLKKHLRVKFIDEHGMEEAGIDGGGVYKEFMYEVMRRAFSPSLYGLFCETPDGHLYPNPAAHVVDEDYVQRFAFVGRLLGKALFDGVLVDIPLASFFLSKLMLKFNYPSDLRSLDPELYKNLMFLRKCDSEVVDSLGLNFVLTNSAFGFVNEVELVSGGRSIPVTSQNRIEYIHRVSNYRMNTQLQKQSEAFIRGFSEIIRPEYIRLFSERELQLLISGSLSAIDITDLRRNTRYSGGYTEDVDVIRWFWQVVSEFDAEEQSKLLQFVTSSPRAPLLGFTYLNPSFCVHRAEGDARLPTASTCMNLLKLPQYKDIGTLRSKLRYSLHANSGFDLS